MVSCSPAAVSNTLRIVFNKKIFAQPGLIPCNESRRGSLGKESLMKEARRGSAALIDIKPGFPPRFVFYRQVLLLFLSVNANLIDIEPSLSFHIFFVSNFALF